jgi:hypothetical protein
MPCSPGRTITTCSRPYMATRASATCCVSFNASKRMAASRRRDPELRNTTFQKTRVNFRQANRSDDFHVRGSPWLQPSQLVTVECDVLIGFDLIAAENVRSADRLLIARCDQRLSNASDRRWRSRRFRLWFRRGGFEAWRSPFELGQLRRARADGLDRRRPRRT